VLKYASFLIALLQPVCSVRFEWHLREDLKLTLLVCLSDNSPAVIDIMSCSIVPQRLCYAVHRIV